MYISWGLSWRCVLRQRRDNIHYNICSACAYLITDGRHGNHTLSSSMSKEEYNSFWIWQQHKKALCEMLPLLLYPIFFLLFTMPIFGLAVSDFVGNYGLIASAIFSWLAPCWSFTTSLLLIFHLCAVRCFKTKKVVQIRYTPRRVYQQYNTEEGSVTINETTRLCQKSDTHFSAPNEEWI